MSLSPLSSLSVSRRAGVRRRRRRPAAPRVVPRSNPPCAPLVSSETAPCCHLARLPRAPAVLRLCRAIAALDVWANTRRPSIHSAAVQVVLIRSRAKSILALHSHSSEPELPFLCARASLAARHGCRSTTTPSRRLSSPRPPPTLQAHSPPPMAPPRIARPPLRPPAYRNRTRRRRPDHPHVELPSSVLLRPNRPSEWVALDLLMLTSLPTAALPRQSTAARRAERRLSLLPPSAPLRSPPTPTKPTYR